MERLIYLYACLFIFSVTAVLSKSGTWQCRPQGEDKDLCAECLTEFCRVEAASCLTSLAQDTVCLKEEKTFKKKCCHFYDVTNVACHVMGMMQIGIVSTARSIVANHNTSHKVL